MSKIIVTNSFSLNMVAAGHHVEILKTINGSAAQAAEALVDAAADGGEIASSVGHADMAALISQALGISIPMNRVSVSLAAGCHNLLVAQYKGPRLPEGATELPEGATIQWVGVKLMVAAD